MDWQGPGFVIAIIALSMIGWIATTWIRARHGYPLTDDNGETIVRDGLPAERKLELLTGENARMTGQIGRLEERIAVLERIVTDRSSLLSDEIERLR